MNFLRSLGKKHGNKVKVELSQPPLDESFLTPTVSSVSLVDDSETLKRKLEELLKKYNIEEVEKEVAALAAQRALTRKDDALSLPNNLTSSKEMTTEHVTVGNGIEKFDFSAIDEELKIRAIQVFNFADKDGNGFIDELELHSLLNDILGPISRPESNRVYHAMDTNHSGTITFDEFLLGLIKYHWDTSPLDAKMLRVKKRQGLYESSSGSKTYEWEISHEEILFHEKLGEGCYGEVYSARWRGSRVAVKKLTRPLNQQVLEDFRNEVAILSKLRHPHLLLFMGACTSTTSDLCIVTEYMECGNLQDLIHSSSKVFDLKTVITWAKQTAFGVNYLHLERIIHRDLKPSNLLLDKYYNVKLCDFGLAIKLRSGTIRESAGTPVWRAPEMLRDEPYDEKADTYSFGLTIWECLSRINLTDDTNFDSVETYTDLVTSIAIQNKRPTIPAFTPTDMKDLIKLCWSADPVLRPNFGQIITYLERIGSPLALGSSHIKIPVTSILFTPRALRKA